MILSALHIYPIKSTAGLDRNFMDVQARGLENDRRWMIVDANCRFLTGRDLSRLVLIRAEPDASGLRLTAPGMPDLSVATPAQAAPRLVVTVWNDVVDSACAESTANSWLSEFLQQPVRLVMMDERSLRAVPLQPPTAPATVSFADGYPLLAISQSAVDGLNEKLPAPISMNRFRPNLVIGDCAPHAEDSWRRVRIGEVEFEAVKTCVRCVFTTVDPVLGTRDPTGEPLRTLKNYRRSERGITFGMNLIARDSGRIHVGDTVVAC
ncbi:MAG: MOSC N-terminal beta barrel domain-containing protein [Arenimonas sp.]